MWRRKQAHEKPPFKIYFSPSDEKLISCSSAGHKVQQPNLFLTVVPHSKPVCLQLIGINTVHLETVYALNGVNSGALCACYASVRMRKRGIW